LHHLATHRKRLVADYRDALQKLTEVAAAP
jgi:hypothetical protein